MLDTTKRITIEQLPNVMVYADEAEPTRFYALPDAPRVAVSDQGVPQINLLLYGSGGEGKDFQVTGGQFTMTSALALTPQEQQLLTASLAQRLATANPHEGQGQQGPPPNILSPDWIDGKVQIQLVDQLQASGTPSMQGTNRCIVSLSLDTSQAQALEKAWDNGLPDTVITYDVHIRVAQNSKRQEGAAYRQDIHTPGFDGQSNSQLDLSFSETDAVSWPMTLNGPMPLSQDELNQQIQRISLG
ncbi:MAG: hypothetical protein WCF84_08400 [Anaerolineae bacterium]